MKNYFYTDEISETIAQLMNKHMSSEQVKRIYRGDFTVLPTPEKLDECLPAIIIESVDGDHEFANESLGILYSQYKYRIFYVQPYTYIEGEQVVYNTTKAIEKIANILLYSNTLSLEVEPSETQKGGIVLHIEIKRTSLTPIEEEGVLSLAGVDVAIGALEAVVHFRTFE